MRAVSMLLIAVGVLVATGPSYCEEEAQVPKDILKELRCLVGTWHTEARTGKEKSEGTWSARWAPGKHCLIAQSTQSRSGETGKRVACGVIGWDPATSRITHHDFEC